MKSLIFNRKSLVLFAGLSLAAGLNAQIQSTHTDEKYGYTTVVYKNKTATDKEVLDALDNSVGMGDVIRVTVAPPKPAVVPLIDKNKGEDVWLKPAPAANSGSLTVSIAGNSDLINQIPVNAAPKPIPTPANAPVPVPVAANTMAPVTPAVENRQATSVPVESAVSASPATSKIKSAGSAKSGKTLKKAAKKSSRKSGGAYHYKNRKSGKQRYSCPKF